jgi:hypothetical protein
MFTIKTPFSYFTSMVLFSSSLSPSSSPPKSSGYRYWLHISDILSPPDRSVRRLPLKEQWPVPFVDSELGIAMDDVLNYFINSDQDDQ